MKSQTLTRLLGSALAAACFAAISPTLSAQTAGTYVSSGLAKYQQGDDDGAMADYSKALALDASNVGAYLGRGQAKSREGNFDGAIADYGEAIKLKPELAEAYVNRGLAAFLQGNMDGASRDLSKAIELKPDSQAAYFYRALSRDSSTNYQGGSEDFAKALALKSSGDVASDYVLLYSSVYGLRMGLTLDERVKIATGWSNGWTKALAAYLNNKVSEANLLKYAGGAPGDVAVRQQTEAEFFVGMVELEAGDKADAKANFQKSFDASDPSTLVHRMARAELDHSS